MSDQISFFVPGIPKPQPRARSFVLRGKGGKPILSKTGQPILRVHEEGSAENWKSLVAQFAKPFVPMPPHTGPLCMDVDFIFPRPKTHYRTNGQLKESAPAWHTIRPDCDNCRKAVEDALKVLGLFCDDCQICAGQTRKFYGVTPGAQVTIRVMVNGDLAVERQRQTS